MKVTVRLVRHWPMEETHTLPLNVEDDATINDLLDLLPTEMFSRVEVDPLYKMNNRSFSWGSWNIDYVVSDDRVLWKPANEDIKVSDFFETFGIKDNSITITTGLGGRGGGIGQEIWSHWPEILIALQVFSSTKDLVF